MNKITVLCICLLISLPGIIAEETSTCIDSNTLQIIKNVTLAVDGVDEVIETTKTKNCPLGCVNGECKPIKSNILTPIYILFCCFGVLMMLVSFLKSDVIIFKWITVILFFLLGVSSFNINTLFCELTSSGWDCFVHQYTATNLAYLWFGLGAVMLVYAIYSSIYQPLQEVAKKV